MPLCSKQFNKKDGIPPREFNIIDSENGVHPVLQAGLERGVCTMYYEYRTAASRRGTSVDMSKNQTDGLFSRSANQGFIFVPGYHDADQSCREQDPGKEHLCDCLGILWGLRQQK